MQKAVTLIQRFGLFAPKTAESTGPSSKDDLFSRRLQRLQRVQAQQATGQVFRNRRQPQEA